MPPVYHIPDLADGILAGHTPSLARGITLVESSLPQHQPLAAELLQRLLPHTGGSHRLGITGVPGVGKSTAIEALGMALADGRNQRVAVLAVDPSSSRSRGSIMGDKTRMPGLAAHPLAFVRPSPAGAALGGVARRTRETMLLCEAAGYQWVLVETVGVGQSETLVRDMTDCFLLLLLAGAGDELQGIKRGIMEMADLLAVTKADGDNIPAARRAAASAQAALRLFPHADSGLDPKVLTLSALHGTGMEGLLTELDHFFSHIQDTGWQQRLRARQRTAWFRQLVQEVAWQQLAAQPGFAARMQQLETAVEVGSLHPPSAAMQLLTDASDAAGI